MTSGSSAGVILNWHVDDVAATLDRLVELGATQHDPITERGAGFVTASVVDPFGNVLRVMANPHYLEMLAAGPADRAGRRTGVPQYRTATPATS